MATFTLTYAVSDYCQRYFLVPRTQLTKNRHEPPDRVSRTHTFHLLSGSARKGCFSQLAPGPSARCCSWLACEWKPKPVITCSLPNCLLSYLIVFCEL